ncbi:MarR family winged helix-turn-helix transcriptional regulator [Jiella avicenniae]|uniref:MarR family winged helix-turn-helix transcriptional regulator n=1 Tax=Jiella avicenniae TaxID=2907202 RepID=A0A9X1NYT9_9HYPH|nr:MarR family winged helix-turn-helix transcriptional regulator [Jiella avicenniae]MCE7028290.1 MarR family winged helix-turn-helix transcriptional regulator [Jiella avicenniae]
MDTARHLADAPNEAGDYILDEQVGFLLRQAQQRHAGLFSECFGGDVTPTQWAVLAKLAEIGECSQNLLGRYTAMDVATIKGVVQRLLARRLVLRRRDPDDGRQLLISLSDEGRAAFEGHLANARKASDRTLSVLDERDRAVFLRCLRALR